MTSDSLGQACRVSTRYCPALNLKAAHFQLKAAQLQLNPTSAEVVESFQSHLGGGVSLAGSESESGPLSAEGGPECVAHNFSLNTGYFS